MADQRKPLDITKLIAQANANRAQAEAKRQAAERNASLSKKGKEIQTQAEVKFGYADTLDKTLNDIEGQLQVFITKMGRGDTLSSIEQRDFDRIAGQYNSVVKTYNSALKEGEAILAKMPKEVKAVIEKESNREEKATGQDATGTDADSKAKIEDYLKSVAKSGATNIKQIQQYLKDAKKYTGPVNGVYNLDLQNAMRVMEAEIIALEPTVGTIDRVTYYAQRGNEVKAGGVGTGTGLPAATGSMAIFDATRAKSYINNLTKNLLGRDATPKEISVLSAKLKAEQSKPENSTVTKYKMVNGVKTAVTTGGLDEEQFLVDIITKNPEYTKRKESAQNVSKQDLMRTALANGLDLDKTFAGQLPVWLKRIENGEDPEAFKQIIRNTAKIGLPDKVSKLLDQGLDLEAVYAPYRNTMAAVLEINPDGIQLSDPTLRMAITPEKEMSIYDFQRELRRDPRWQYTDNARSEAADVATTVLKDFGFMG